jgi:5'-nucleotidase
VALAFAAIIFIGPAWAQDAPFTILVTNDDGYSAPGIRALAEALKPLGEVIVAAPAQNQSGKGHSITTSDPILVLERKQSSGLVWYAIEATPATATRLALDKLVPRRADGSPRVDLVVSGINRGENLGIVVYYSGTLGAAREASFTGIPAIAVSMGGDNEADYAATAAAVRAMIERLREKKLLQPGLFLNVNAPAGQTKGVMVTRLSLKANEQIYDRRVNPRNRIYFWPDYKPLETDDEGTDVWAFAQGWITVTPMVLDTTADRQLGAMKALENKARAATR